MRPVDHPGVPGTGAVGLLAAQRARFAVLDPLLPAAAPPPMGEVLVAETPSGARVAGVLVHTSWPVGSLRLLWSAAAVAEMYPLVGGTGGVGLHALLAGWACRRAELAALGPDSACAVTWPSRDVEGTRALLDHGFQPLSVIAVRTAGAPRRPRACAGGVQVRLADAADLESCLRLALHEHAYSALVGGSVLREGVESLKRAGIRDRLARGDPVWLAERSGRPVGLAECGWSDARPGCWAGGALPGGRWAYVNCVSASPGERGGGIGQLLMDTAHRGMHTTRIRGSYLYFNPANPLSSVFWPRQGYRPLWTLWELRPAAALR